MGVEGEGGRISVAEKCNKRRRRSRSESRVVEEVAAVHEKRVNATTTMAKARRARSAQVEGGRTCAGS